MKVLFTKIDFLLPATQAKIDENKADYSNRDDGICLNECEEELWDNSLQDNE